MSSRRPIESDFLIRGVRVIAPFRNEKLIGVVTATEVMAPTDFEAKYIETVLDDEPLLSQHLLKLAEWIAGYYLAPVGEVLRGMLPLMAEVRRVVYYRMTDRGRDVLASSSDGDGMSSQVSKARSGAPASRRGNRSVEDMGMERRVLERLVSGEPVKVSTLRTATAASLPVLAGMLRKKWIVRETAATERDARRTERFAVLVVVVDGSHGHPGSSGNFSHMTIMQPLLANPALKPQPSDIAQSRDAFREFLKIRGSSGLFHMQSLADVQANLHFLNTGPNQVPGLIVMKLDANGGDFDRFQHIVVVFNATDAQTAFENPALVGLKLRLHDVQRHSADPIVRQSSFNAQTGTAVVPALTTAVFVTDQP